MQYTPIEGYIYVDRDNTLWTGHNGKFYRIGDRITYGLGRV